MTMTLRHASEEGSLRLALEDGGLARLTFDAPDRSVNILTSEVMGRLSEILAELGEACAGGEVRALLVSSAKPTFIVGADIGELAEVDDPNAAAELARLGQRIYGNLERLPVPTAAAIHGACMGGGTELALACRYRIASDHAKTKIGLPEVRLGILPAWGGTTRLPRLVGLGGALDLLLTGKTLDGRGAKRIGLVDAVFPHDLFLDLATDFLRERIAESRALVRPKRHFAVRLLDDTAPGRRLLLWTARKRTIERTGGHYPAPLRILKLLRASYGQPIERALEAEALAAGELIGSPTSRNLIHVFRLRERARKGLRRFSPAASAEFRRIGVVGAGTMGGGIAQLAASHGIQVRMRDVQSEPIGRALRHARELYDSGVRKRRFTKREAARGMERISGTLDYAGFGPSELAIEAVIEHIDVKKTVLEELESIVAESCVLATNTSSLSVDRMALDLQHPERFLGMHFFNPVHRMPLVEIVRGQQTADWAVARVYALSLAMGKVPVIVGDSPGFLVNRILGPYLNEAGYLLQEGAAIEVVDRAATTFGMPMGPLRLIDEVGLDIVHRAGETLHQALGERLSPAPPLLAIHAAGRLGRRGGSGFYRYAGNAKASVDATAYAAMGRAVPSGSAPAPEETRDRLLLAMINEAARALSEGVTSSAHDLDMAMIMGTGFPPFLGGLLRFADEIGPRALIRRLEGYERPYGMRFSPARLLRELAQEDRGFYEAFPD